MVENRKLQVTGGSTYIVSLPGRWVRENGMEKGSSVSISEEFNILKIRPENYVEKEVARTIELSERYSEGLLNRILISSYIAGFDSLKISTRSYISNEQRDIVRKFTRVAMGVELLEETANSITLQNVLDSESFPPVNALKRMIINVQAMITDTVMALEIKDNALLENIISRDDEVDRYHFYMMKETLGNTGKKNDEMFNMLYSRILERIADHTVNICNTLQKGERMEKEQIDALKGFLEFCSELFQKAATLYFNVNLFEVNDLVSKKEMIKEKKEMLSKIRGKNISTSAITEEISRIGMYSTDIAEITMDAHCYRHESTRI